MTKEKPDQLTWLGKALTELTKEQLIECIYYAHEQIKQLRQQKLEYLEMFQGKES